MRSMVVLVALCASWLTASEALAQYRGPRAGALVTTIIHAQQTPDGREVTLIGQLVARMGPDQYWFSNPTGTMAVRIEPGVWRRAPITPQSVVRITGTIYRSQDQVRLTVRRVDLIAQ
ncbi:MAG: YgiW/YdeI family stress tolerance OB fold protein [Pirellulales bacterium]